MSFYYQQNINGLKRFDNSGTVVELYSYGSGNTISGFTPTISGTLPSGSYESSTVPINTDGTGTGNPRVVVNSLTGELSFDMNGTTPTLADSNTSSLSDDIPNYYGVIITYTPEIEAPITTIVYFKVTPKVLTVAFNSNGNISKNKVYNGNNTANIITSDVNVSGFLESNTLSGIVFTSALYKNKNTGTDKNIFLQGFDFTLASGIKTNYILPYQNFDDDIHISGLEGNITPKDITGTGINKIYDSTTYADISLNNVELGDNVAVNGNFSSKDVSNNKPITANALTGTDISNYTLSSVSNANITHKDITGTSTDRIYDRTTNVTITLNNVEVVDLSNVTLSGSMVDKVVGTNKTVSGLLGGSEAKNYLLSSISTVTISPKIITGTGINKIYDSTTYAGISLNNVEVGDNITVNGNFSSKDVSNNKPITANALTGTDISNYTLSSVSNANITRKDITGTSTDRIYDRTTNVTITLNNVEVVDLSNVTLSGSMVDKVVGTNKTVSGLLGGSEAKNYLLSSISTVTISPKIITGTGINKIYNSTTYADISLNNVEVGDNVAVNGNFSSKDVSNNKPIIANVLTGTDKSNYTLSSVSNANITRKDISGTSINRIYDRTTNVTITLNNVEVTDISNVTLSGSMVDKVVGSNKTVSGLLEGSEASNYLLSSISTVTISPKIITGTADNKLYDGTTTAVVTLSGIIDSDIVSISGNFNNKRVGTGKSVTGLLSNTDASNYTLSSVSNANITIRTVTGKGRDRTYNASTNVVVDLSNTIAGDNISASGTINSKNIGSRVVSSTTLLGTDASNYTIGVVDNAVISIKNITATGQNRVYSASTLANITLNSIEQGDIVSGVAAFTSRYVANSIAIDISSVVLSGSDKDNYNVTSVSPANITPLTLTATGQNKVYNGLTTAAIVYNNLVFVDLSGEDDVNCDAFFNTRHVGTNKSISGVITGGDDSYNYVLGAISNANITKLDISGTGNPKIYNGTTTASVTLNGVLNIDTSNVSVSANFNTRHIGISKTISGTISGSSSGNYNLTNISNSDISALNITGTGNPKIYNGTTTASVTLNGIFNIDTSTVSILANFDTRHVGISKPISGTISGASSGNYILTNISNSDISALNITGYSQNKVYDRLTTATVELRDILEIDGTVTADANFSSKNVSSNISVSGTLVGTNASNYSVTFTTANITKKPLTGYAVDKVYDSTTTTNITLYGVISPDSVSAVGNYITADVGTDKSPTVEFTDAVDIFAQTWSNQSSGSLGLFRNGPRGIYLNDDGTIQISLGHDGTANGLSAIWITRNSGITWTVCKTNSIDAFRAFCMSGNGQIFYVVDTSTFYKSTDSGVTWTQGTTLNIYQPRTISCSQNGQHIFIGSATGFGMQSKISHDYGVTFSDVILPTEMIVSCMSDDGSRIFAFTKTADWSPFGVYRSYDYGETWAFANTSDITPAYSNIGSMKCNGVGTHIMVDSIPFESFDGGVTWSKITSLNNAINNDWTSFSISQDGKYIIVCNPTLKEIWASRNSGTTWNMVQNPASMLPLYQTPYASAISRNGLVTVVYTYQTPNELAIMRESTFNNTYGDAIRGTDYLNYSLSDDDISGGDIIPKALTIDWYMHNKTYDGTNSAVAYYRTISGLYNIDGVINVNGFESSFDNAEVGSVKNVYIVDIVLAGSKSYNYYVPNSTITGSIISQGSNLFMNNTLSINQNGSLYGEDLNIESDLNFDYVLLFNVGGLTGVNNNMTNIFSNSYYIQNAQNPNDVNIHLSIPNHNAITNMGFNWNEINQQNLITVSSGRSSSRFGTFIGDPLRFGETLLEIMAHKIFGHAQARSAISNDMLFNEHDGELWDHLSSSVGNRNIQLSIFNQYIGSGRYNVENKNTEYSDTLFNQNFNFQGMTLDFPFFLAGSLFDETMIFRNGTDVGGSQIVNGSYNIPILLRFHD